FLTTDFLPIELVDFSGDSENCQHQLSWTTATERSNDYFSVEQSFDGLQFSQIGRVEGAGNSDQAIDYGFELELLVNEPAYYRLRQVDEDGTYAFSDVIRLESDCGQPVASVVEVFPNPVTKALRINGMSNQQGKGIAIIYNSLGAKVKTEAFDLPEGKFIRTIDVKDLPTGSYFIHFQGTSNELSVQQFQKME
ncbi:MAG: T9SS type A sorting domain-containing protein, partial [Bacteroidota bacterium]